MSEPVCFRSNVFCAALVTDTSGIHDHGMNQDSWAMLEDLKAQQIIDEVAYIESVDARDYAKNIAYFAENGYDAIFTMGIGMRDETLHAADLYPRSTFIGIDQPSEIPHERVIPIFFPEDQIGFLAGTLAAQLTKTQVVGAVCETSGISSQWRYCEGFRAGVKYIDVNIEALIAYRENGSDEKLFRDENWGADQADEMIRHGADVIFATGGGTGQGALREAIDSGIFVIGAERDQAAALGESISSVVTSIYGDAGFEVQEMMRMLVNGETPQGGSGRFSYVPLNLDFPQNVNNELNQILNGLVSGEIQTKVKPERP
jgi:basic membrane protein A